MTKEPKISMVIILYCLILYFIWFVLEIFIVSKIELQEISFIIDVIKEILLKIILWFIPALLLIRHFDEYMYIKKGEILSVRFKVIKYIPIFLIFTIYHLISAYVQNGQISLSGSFSAIDILIAFSVGISEEMVFRGWLLNSALNEDQNWLPILVNAVMFLIIHFPIWIKNGVFLEYLVSGAFLQIILLSIIFSWTFIKSKSIVIPAFLHIYWDFLCFIL